MKFSLILTLFFYSFGIWGNCLLLDVSYKEIPLKKVIIKESTATDVWTYLKIDLDGKILGGDGFFCSQEGEFKRCFGNDESGQFLIKKNGVKIISLKIRVDDKDIFQFKGAKEWIPLEKIKCSPFFN